MEIADTWTVQITHELVLQLPLMRDESYLDALEKLQVMVYNGNRVSGARRKRDYTPNVQLALCFLNITAAYLQCLILQSQEAGS